MSDLSEYLLGAYDVPEEPEERERWRIDHDEVASWALRKLAAIQGEQQRLKDDAEAEIERIKAWRDQAIGTLDGDARFIEGALIDYHRRLRLDGKAGKTYKLPAGDLKATKEQDAVVLPTEDDAELELVKWCLDNERLDLLKIAPSLSAIKEAVLKGGEAIPGVQAVRGSSDANEDRYSVRPVALP